MVVICCWEGGMFLGRVKNALWTYNFLYITTERFHCYKFQTVRVSNCLNNACAYQQWVDLTVQDENQNVEAIARNMLPFRFRLFCYSFILFFTVFEFISDLKQITSILLWLSKVKIGQLPIVCAISFNLCVVFEYSLLCGIFSSFSWWLCKYSAQILRLINNKSIFKSFSVFSKNEARWKHM